MTTRQHDDPGLEQVLRATLAGRATRITTGPSWTTAPSRTAHKRDRRAPWLAAAAVAVVAAGASWLATSATMSRPTAGATRAACRTTLPAAWRAALHGAGGLSVDGRPADVQAVTPDGTRSVVEWTGADHVHHVDVVSGSGVVREIAHASTDRQYTRIDADDSYAVLSTNTRAEARDADFPVDDVTLVDLATGDSRELLDTLPVPHGWIVATGGAVIQTGEVYLSIAPRADELTRGVIIRYDVATRTYRTVSAVRADPVLDRDVRGVAWPGGSAANPSAPPGLPAQRLTDQSHLHIQSDGRDSAWTDPRTPFVLHWSDDLGRTESYELRLGSADGRRLVPEVDAVSGPIVVLHSDGTSAPWLLFDVRTGAYAPIDSGRPGQAFGVPGSLLLDTQAGAARVELSGLPELRC